MNRNLFLTRIQNEVLIYTCISSVMKWGGWLKTGIPGEVHNLDNPDLLFGFYRDYIKAGTDIITTNTLGANRAQLSQFGLSNRIRQINLRAIEIAQKAANGRVSVAGVVGPTGISLKPPTEHSFETFIDIFREQIVALNEGHPDLLLIKNISEIREMKAALIACRELYRGPVISEMTLEKNEPEAMKLDSAAMVTILASFRPDVVGVASSKASKLLHHLEKMVMVGQTRISAAFDSFPRESAPMTPETMGDYALQFVEMGASIIGGGSASTPEHIREIALRINHRKPAKWNKKQTTSLASQTRLIQIESEFASVFIGNRLNSLANPEIKKYLEVAQIANLLVEAERQIEKGARILQVNLVGAGDDATKLMAQLVVDLESRFAPVLCLCSDQVAVLEAGLKNITGKALVQMPGNDDSTLSSVLPLARKYGAAVIVGMPTGCSTVEAKIRGVEKQFAVCGDYGIDLQDIWIDCSCKGSEEDFNLTVKFIKTLKEKYSVRTVCSFSNLASNKTCTNSFLEIALNAGLDVPIIDPLDSSKIATILSVDLSLGRKKNQD